MRQDADTRRVAVVDAFTAEPLSGNPAGVVPAADGLSEAAMRAIAREINASETAFLFEDGEADRRIRYFTPTDEVDLCGHATVASHALLAEEGLSDGSHTLATNAGTLTVELDGGTVWMTGTTPEVEPVDLGYDRLADALGVDPSALRTASRYLPVARASTGLAFLVIPVTYLDPLGGMAPDMDAVEALSAEYDVAGVYAFTFETLTRAATLHARCFVPAAGVPEDPVTGTAAGACGAYLDYVRAFEAGREGPVPVAAGDEGAEEGEDDERGSGGTADGAGADDRDRDDQDEGEDGDGPAPRSTPAEMVFEQGHFLDRGGRVRVRASRATGAGIVRVGGEAVVAIEGEVRVPPLEDGDGIIEA